MLLSPLRPDVSVGVVFRKDSKDRVFKFRGPKERSAMY
ncbi:hypothetical protein LEP1GSC051_0729 [Leptospira sp. P2653]|uniref:Uncharacterized protein n=1 Tax=Leptospira weilii str. UI 13098 TaxID=1088542 RepID=M6QH01_9LEPT|nr:hypothetical protein LEP1GSC051_0729 [Leptospira sp. P2653]EMN42845.1 hypothetical protein LEP1GSC086_1731 [Leptospira weilii str. LNT 1234]EMN92535.1 hypothetical protein LEP1GSC108_3790 [Leptospira weilii str. UI 13098]